MNKIRKGDEVIVRAGKDKGRRGTVLQVFSDGRVLVEGVNIAKKHVKPNPNAGEQGGRGIPPKGFEPVEREVTGLLARAFMHETDHLAAEHDGPRRAEAVPLDLARRQSGMEEHVVDAFVRPAARAVPGNAVVLARHVRD